MFRYSRVGQASGKLIQRQQQQQQKQIPLFNVAAVAPHRNREAGSSSFKSNFTSAASSRSSNHGTMTRRSAFTESDSLLISASHIGIFEHQPQYHRHMLTEIDDGRQGQCSSASSSSCSTADVSAVNSNSMKQQTSTAAAPLAPTVSVGAAVMATAAMSFSSSPFLVTSRRGGWWGIFASESADKRKSETEEQLRAQLPEVFDTISQTPQDMQDYIRPDKTIFEKLEDYWDYAQSFLNPVQKQLDWMRGLHEGSFITGGMPVEWSIVFLSWGFLIRLLSLVPMLYAHRNALRMARISPQLNEIQLQQKRLKGDKSLSSAEKKIMKDGYKRMEKALYKKHGCSQKRAFISGMTTPVMISAFMAIRRLTMYEDSLETASFLWVTDLTMPDPYNVLPMICGALFVFNFEMNQSLSRGGRGSQVLYVRWAMRVGGFVFLYFFSSQPSALFAYWIGMSAAGMIQPVLLRWQWFRTYFNFPDANKVALQHKTIIDKVMDAWKYGMRGGKGVDDAAVDEARARLERDGAKTVRGKVSGQSFQHISDEEVVFDAEEAKDAASLKKRADRGQIGFM